MKKFLENEIGLLLLLVLFVISAFVVPDFFTVENIQNFLVASAIVGSLSIGAALVLLSGNIDLTPGSIVALCSVLAAYFTRFSIVLAVFAAIASSLIIGTATGLLASKARIPALLATLGMMGIARSGALFFANGLTVSTRHSGLQMFSEGKLLGVPLPFYTVLVSIVLMSLILNYSKWGRGVYAVGGNEQSAFYSGIKTGRIKLQLFMVASVFYGIGGLLYTGRINSGNPEGGVGYELDAITAAVLGGIDLRGGRGRIRNVIIGALILAIISNLMNLLGISAYYQQITKGLLFIAIVGVRMLLTTNLAARSRDE
jgi:ribose/xylose/arabinose/galactoside ABC-type transport system permease subunit